MGSIHEKNCEKSRDTASLKGQSQQFFDPIFSPDSYIRTSYSCLSISELGF